MPLPGADAEDAVRLPDAPELLSNDPDGYAWGVLRDRTPKLIRQFSDAHPYEPGQRRALSDLLEEMLTGTVQPLGDGAPDRAAWDEWGRDHFGRRWADVPFLWWESYFYRRVLAAVGFFEPGPWFWVDPFESLKSAELRDPALEADLAALDQVFRLPVEEQAQAKLLASLWGNRADLGFRVELGDEHPEQAGLVADDSARLWSLLPAGAGNRVCVVADNAGRELVADLVLIDHLMAGDLAGSVALHVKPRPYYVSDAITTDVVACLRRLAATPGTAAAISGRLWAAMGDGRLTLHTHEFYCAPWSFHRLPADLAREFAGACLTLVKGDLNYRRLVGDRGWPGSLPFADVTAYFPGPVAALRTLKSDVVTGVDPAVLAALDATGEAWRTTGTHGSIQVRG
ncbi:damage-control phosphatase ARMT1 family protein [Actinomadura scrupuli]|uniref:damage-control phosphatase ARMT1 family protein n=1 Tax=Actinomadura scrupuli TaxID=559629 RepID=UPI003D983BD9